MSQDDVGVFYLALSVVGILSIFSDLGISSAFARYIPYYCGKDEKNKAYLLLHSSYFFSGVLSILIGATLFLLSELVALSLNNPFLSRPLQFAAIYLVLTTFFGLNIGFIQGRKNIEAASLLSTTQNILKLALLFLFFWLFGPTLDSLMLSFVLSFLFVTVGSFFYTNKETDKFKVKNTEVDFSLGAQFKMLKEVVPFGLTLSFVSMLWSFVANTDKILMSILLPQDSASASIGIYAIATSLASLIVIFATPIGAIFLPLLSELHGKGDKKGMHKISATAFRWIIYLMVPFTLLIIVLPDNMLNLFYGAAYVPGRWVLVIFTLGIFIRLISSVHSWILAALRLVHIEFYAAAVAAIINIVMNIILVPIYGIEGAAFASLLSFAVVTIMIIYFSKKYFGFGIPAGTYKPIIAGLIALVLVVLLKDWTIGFMEGVQPISFFNNEILDLISQKMIKLAVLGALFAFACAVYFLSLGLLKAFGKEDVELVSIGMKKFGAPEGFVLVAQRLMGAGID